MLHNVSSVWVGLSCQASISERTFPRIRSVSAKDSSDTHRLLQRMLNSVTRNVWPGPIPAERPPLAPGPPPEWASRRASASDPAEAAFDLPASPIHRPEVRCAPLLGRQVGDQAQRPDGRALDGQPPQPAGVVTGVAAQPHLSVAADGRGAVGGVQGSTPRKAGYWFFIKVSAFLELHGSARFVFAGRINKRESTPSKAAGLDARRSGRQDLLSTDRSGDPSWEQCWKPG